MNVASILNRLFNRRVIVSEDYLIRWHLIPDNKWCNIFLHKFNGPDPGRHLHDHPWNFATIILRGNYTEYQPDRPGRRLGSPSEFNKDSFQSFSAQAGDVHFRKAEFIHTIYKVQPGTWSLIVTGRGRREWGFHTPGGWVHWKTYSERK